MRAPGRRRGKKCSRERESARYDDGEDQNSGESHPSRRDTRARHGRIGPREGCHTTAAPTSELGPAGARCPAAATSSMRAGHRRERSTRRERRLAAMLPGGEPSAWNTALSARSCSARPITACRLLAIGRARPTDNDGWTWRSRFEETTDGPSSSRARYPSRRMLPARYPGRTRSLCQGAGHLAGALVPQGQWTCPYSRKVQQRVRSTAATDCHQQSPELGAGDERPALPLVRDAEAGSSNLPTPTTEVAGHNLDV
jgi:hypothetical protein